MIVENDQLLLKKLQECMIACNHCLNECLTEDHVEMMLDCIRLDRECVEICSVLESAIIRQSPYTNQLAEICLVVCNDCSEQCEKHEHRHCQYCAVICRECAEACRDFLNN